MSGVCSAVEDALVPEGIAAGIGVLGIVKNTLVVTVLDYLARLHHNDLIGDVGHDGEVVADEYHADIARFVNSQCDYFTEVSWPENEYRSIDTG